MKTAQEIAGQPSALLKIEISPDVRTGQSVRRKVRVGHMGISESVIKLHLSVYTLNKTTANEMTGKGFDPVEYVDPYYCDERGPFVDPVTHKVIQGVPNAQGVLEYPNNTITRFKDIMKTFDVIPAISQKELLTIIINELNESDYFNQ